MCYPSVILDWIAIRLSIDRGSVGEIVALFLVLERPR